jgi:hypothetical protein
MKLVSGRFKDILVLDASNYEEAIAQCVNSKNTVVVSRKLPPAGIEYYSDKGVQNVVYDVREETVIVDGEIRKESKTYSGKHEGRLVGNCSADLYSGGPESLKNAIIYNDRMNMFNISFYAHPEKSAPSYTIQWGQGPAICYYKYNGQFEGLRGDIAHNPSLKGAYHRDFDPEFGRALGQSLVALDYIPEELPELLEKIVKDNKSFKKNKVAFMPLYEYLMGDLAQTHL